MKIKSYIEYIYESNLLLDDVTLVESKLKRGTFESGARTFDILISDPVVVEKMKKTPMGYDGKMNSIKYDGPSGSLYKEFQWTSDTSQWEVWQNMNYLIVTPRNEVHWYHGKIPGGTYNVQKTETGEINKDGVHQDPVSGQKYVSFSQFEKINKSLSSLNDVKRFGYKVYTDLIDLVNYITSTGESTNEVRRGVYSHLINDRNFVWIMNFQKDKSPTQINLFSNVPDYKNIIVIKSTDNVKEISEKWLNELSDPMKEGIETLNKDFQLIYSPNFPK
jgi:hypothetical protein